MVFNRTKLSRGMTSESSCAVFETSNGTIQTASFAEPPSWISSWNSYWTWSTSRDNPKKDAASKHLSVPCESSPRYQHDTQGM